jgi:polyisoprenoid-binding protein YceI
MSRRTIVWLSVLGGVVVLGVVAAFVGPRIYAGMMEGSADAAPTVSAPTSESTIEDTSDLSGSWTVADGSYAGYRVDEVLNGADVTVTGRTDQVTGDLTTDGLTLTEASITVDVASIATDSSNRDDYFRNNALQTNAYPEAAFVLTEPLTTTGAPVSGESQIVQVTGELTIHGVTQTVTAEMEAVLSGDGGQIAGSIPITFADFDVEAPSLGFVSVVPEGFIEFLLVVEPA